jgi:hypothetical protein
MTTASRRDPDLRGKGLGRGMTGSIGSFVVRRARLVLVGSLPLIVVDTVGLLCGGLTLAVALSLRGSLIRPATWNNCNETPISRGAAARVTGQG